MPGASRGSVVVSDTSTGLAVDLRVRMLVMHQADGFSERGMALSLSYNPTPSTPLGFTARVAPSWAVRRRAGPRRCGAGRRWRGWPTAASRQATASRARSATGCRWEAASWGRRGSASAPRSTDGTIGYGLGVLDRERLNLELGVDAHRRESPMLDGTDNGFLGRATMRW